MILKQIFMRKILVSVLLLGAFFSLTAQTKISQVESATQYLINALISGKQTDLEYIASDSLRYGHSSGKIQNKKEFVFSLVSNQSDFVSIDITKQQVTIEGKTAIVQHNLQGITNDSGNPGKVYLGIMLVFTQNNKGDWKLLARQAYKI